MTQTIKTWADLKVFANSLSDEQLTQEVVAWGEHPKMQIEGAEVLNEDYINPSGECPEPISYYTKGHENCTLEEGDDEEDYLEEPVVAKKGEIYLFT